MNSVLLPEGAVGYKPAIPWQCETFGCESGAVREAIENTARQTDPCEAMIHLIDCPLHNIHHIIPAASLLYFEPFSPSRGSTSHQPNTE